MKTRILFLFALHLFIVASYMGVTSWLFVTYPVPDPLAMGLQQWVCILVHISVTVLICLLKRRTAIDRKKATTTLWLHVVAIVCWIVVYLFLSAPIAAYLWRLRSQ
ncbi:MAG: hypothetical protein HYU70_05235 [Bacteroidetes bacterium]|nr:hypothetical protein [Bacteroidota bacterium]